MQLLKWTPIGLLNYKVQNIKFHLAADDRDKHIVKVKLGGGLLYFFQKHNKQKIYKA